METPQDTGVMAAAAPRLKSYHAFFDFYLKEQTTPLSRTLHLIGGGIGLASAILAVWDAQPLWIVAGLVLGYIFSWVGHTLAERHRPVSLSHPIWALIADYHALFLTMTGQIDARRQGARHDHDYRP